MSQPSQDFRSFLREFWWFLGESRWRMLGLFSIITVCSATSLIPPWFLGKVLEVIPLPGAIRTIVLYAIAMTVLLIALHWLRVRTKQITANLRASISARARQQAIDLLLAQGLSEGRLVGNEVARLDTGLRDYGELHRMFQNEILFGFVSFIGCCAVFVVQAPVLLLSTVAYLVFFYLMLQWSLPRVRAAQTTVSQARESFSGMFANVIGNALSVQASGAEESMGKRVGSSVQELEQSEFKRNQASSRQWATLNVLNTMYLGIALAQTGYLGATGALSVSLVVVAYSYVRELIRSVVGIMDVAEEFVQNYVGFGRLLHLLSAADEVFERTDVLGSAWQTIEVRNISHSYPECADDVLTNIDWTIRRGQRFGLRGESGAGKSTLIKVLLGLLHPKNGSVLLDGRDLLQISRASLREQFAIALQECEILALSLRDNITLCREVDAEWLREIVAACGLSDLIGRLPQGIDTLVGERGYKLSGGERQRVALARAIVRKPTLLVIDEATSMLDAATEKGFFDGLERLLPGLTLLVISHHERGLSRASEFFELKNGSLARIDLQDQAAAAPGSELPIAGAEGA